MVLPEISLIDKLYITRLYDRVGMGDEVLVSVGENCPGAGAKENVAEWLLTVQAS